LDAASGVAPNAVAAPGESLLFRVRVRDIWRYLQRQKASFWLVNIFLFLEYVRPQSIYPALDFFPWSMACVALAFVATVAEGGRGRRWTVIDTGMVAFTAVVLASSAQAYDPGFSFKFDNISIYISWLVIYFAISTSINTEQKFFVLMLAFLLYNLKMSQHVVKVWASMGFGFSQWAAVGAPGWFHNPGELAIEMVIFLPLAFLFYQALRRYWTRYKRWFFLFLPFSALVAIAAASSRGAQLAAGVVVLWLLFKSRYKVRGVVLAIVAAGAVYLVLPAEQKARFTEMGEDQTSVNRLVLWEHGIDIANNHPVLGVGYKNWIPYYRSHYVAGGQLPHNIFVEAGAELGYLGLGAFLFLIGGTLAVNYRTRRLARRLGRDGAFMEMMAHGLDAALLGYLVAGFFVTVLFYPFFWINLGMTGALYGTASAAARVYPGPGGGDR
jgi:O-antigen ligase